ncbi:hypothetical protein MMA231_00963 [Asticcacaulis sp. MM231]|uniref:DUF935 domain-containing protein n=1 Tax=Asticcacaulis sp. MM231 TaxID=3157666 RepID=UPI0032D580AE
MVDFLSPIKALFAGAKRSETPRAFELESRPVAEGPLDAEGRVIDKAVLAQEIAAPTFGGVRSILFNGVTGGLDPFKLQRILNSAVQGQADEFYQLAEEMEEKYPHYQATLKTRKLAVTQSETTVEAAGDDPRSQKDAELIREYLKRGDLELEMYDIEDAQGKGWSATELVWPEGTARLKYPMLPRLKTRPQQFFQFDQVDGETLLLKGGVVGTSALPVPLPGYKFIIRRAAGKTGLTVRGGLARSVAWAYLFQNMALKDWVILAEVYGMPVRIGKYDRNATETDRNALLNAVVNIGTDAAAIIPNSMVIDFVDAMASASPDVYKALCEYLDQQVSKLVLGQTATTDATSGGLGGSQGNVHNDVRQDYQRADQRALSATLTRDLVIPIIVLNHGAPPSGLYPVLRLGQAETFTKEQADMIYEFVDRGGSVELSIIGDKLGLPDAPEGPDVKLLQPRSKGVQVSGADNAAQNPDVGLSDAKAATAMNAASNRILGHLKTALSSVGGPQSDAVDIAVQEMADEWTPVMAPLIDGLEAALAASSSFEDAKAKLLLALDTLPDTELTALLARTRFAARRGRRAMTSEAAMASNTGTFQDLFIFQRARKAPFIGANGRIREAAVDEPRLDFNIDGEPLGLLIEGRETSLRADLIGLAVLPGAPTYGTVLHDYIRPDGVREMRAIYSFDPAATIKACLNMVGHQRRIAFFPQFLTRSNMTATAPVRYGGESWEMAGLVLVDTHTALEAADSPDTLMIEA